MDPTTIEGERERERERDEDKHAAPRQAGRMVLRGVASSSSKIVQQAAEHIWRTIVKRNGGGKKAKKATARNPAAEPTNLMPI